MSASLFPNGTMVRKGQRPNENAGLLLQLLLSTPNRQR